MSVEASNAESVTVGSLVLILVAIAIWIGVVLFFQAHNFDRFDDLMKRHWELKREIGEVRGQVRSTEWKVEQVEGDVGRAQREVTEVRSQVTGARGEIMEVRTRITRVQGEVTDVKTDVSELRGRMRARSSAALR